MARGPTSPVRLRLPICSRLTVAAIALYRALIAQSAKLPLPAPSRAALANVVSVIFNLDEALNKE